MAQTLSRVRRATHSFWPAAEDLYRVGRHRIQLRAWPAVPFQAALPTRYCAARAHRSGQERWQRQSGTHAAEARPRANAAELADHAWRALATALPTACGTATAPCVGPPRSEGGRRLDYGLLSASHLILQGSAWCAPHRCAEGGAQVSRGTPRTLWRRSLLVSRERQRRLTRRRPCIRRRHGCHRPTSRRPQQHDLLFRGHARLHVPVDGRRLATARGARAGTAIAARRAGQRARRQGGWRRPRRQRRLLLLLGSGARLTSAGAATEPCPPVWKPLAAAIPGSAGGADGRARVVCPRPLARPAWWPANGIWSRRKDGLAATVGGALVALELLAALLPPAIRHKCAATRAASPNWQAAAASAADLRAAGAAFAAVQAARVTDDSGRVRQQCHPRLSCVCGPLRRRTGKPLLHFPCCASPYCAVSCPCPLDLDLCLPSPCCTQLTWYPSLAPDRQPYGRGFRMVLPDTLGGGLGTLNTPLSLGSLATAPTSGGTIAGGDEAGDAGSAAFAGSEMGTDSADGTASGDDGSDAAAADAATRAHSLYVPGLGTSVSPNLPTAGTPVPPSAPRALDQQQRLSQPALVPPPPPTPSLMGQVGPAPPPSSEDEGSVASDEIFEDDDVVEEDTAHVDDDADEPHARTDDDDGRAGAGKVQAAAEANGVGSGDAASHTSGGGGAKQGGGLGEGRGEAARARKVTGSPEGAPARQRGTASDVARATELVRELGGLYKRLPKRARKDITRKLQVALGVGELG